jgi:hypothetical protein
VKIAPEQRTEQPLKHLDHRLQAQDFEPGQVEHTAQVAQSLVIGLEFQVVETGGEHGLADVEKVKKGMPDREAARPY